jgi:hypothetical protein
MPAESEITVRQLPDGVPRRAAEQSWHGSVVEIELLGEAGSGELDPGSLAEIESTGSIYLGAVTSRREASVMVDIEHALDRTKLSRIQEMWNQRER